MVTLKINRLTLIGEMGQHACDEDHKKAHCTEG